MKCFKCKNEFLKRQIFQNCFFLLIDLHQRSSKLLKAMTSKQSSSSGFKSGLKKCNRSVEQSCDKVSLQSESHQAILLDQCVLGTDDVAGQSKMLNKHKEHPPPIAKVFPVSRSPHPKDFLRDNLFAWHSLLNSSKQIPQTDFTLSPHISAPINHCHEDRTPSEISYLASLYMSGFPYLSSYDPAKPIHPNVAYLQRCSQMFANTTTTSPIIQSSMNDLGRKNIQNLLSMPRNEACIIKAGNTGMASATTSNWDPQILARKALMHCNYFIHCSSKESRGFMFFVPTQNCNFNQLYCQKKLRTVCSRVQITRYVTSLSSVEAKPN